MSKIHMITLINVFLFGVLNCNLVVAEIPERSLVESWSFSCAGENPEERYHYSSWPELTNLGYAFGRSYIESDAYNQCITKLSCKFDKPYVVTKISFDEIERYGNWGSRGWVVVNGNRIERLDFGRGGAEEGSEIFNDHHADTNYRHHELENLGSYLWPDSDEISSIEFVVWDITDESEIFVKNIEVMGCEKYIEIFLELNSPSREVVPTIESNSFKVLYNAHTYPYIPTPTCKGYEFKGWSYLQSGDGVWVKEGAAIDFTRAREFPAQRWPVRDSA